ncbi:hypothetical protein ACM16X_02680 [Haloarcula japonica]|uniref:hypothetical protein n=1 Tax=Haloarcula japonica TaxID=29282 RepID=UPI0039F6A48A
MTVDEVSREVYQDLQDSGYLSKMRTQNLIWIHEFYEEFGEWPTTGELQNWIREEKDATIIKQGLDHDDVGPNQIRPRCNELHDEHGVVEKLEMREQEHKTTKAQPLRILYDRVEQEMGVSLQPESEDPEESEGPEYETKIRNGRKVYVVDGEEYVFPPDQVKDQDSELDDEDTGETEDAENVEDKEDGGEIEQKTLMKDGEVVT